MREVLLSRTGHTTFYRIVRWSHLALGVPILLLTTVLPLRPIKGWLVAAQYATRAQEAGTAKLWGQLHGRDKGRAKQ